jgi:hypothetical protein
LPQVSPSLCVAPVEGERLARLLIAGNGHEQTDTPFSLFILTSSVASFLPRHLTEFPVLRLQFIIALVEVNVNDIPRAFLPKVPSGYSACQYCWRLNRLS